ncbi:MAG TPA: acetolactate synthase large subunit [Acidimicrobiales bacterium]|nr:acetolactate synthase large subunit [Acidimicrobiales bacterium]
MNGAEALLRTLVGSDVDVCFANPGTSEMHFVAALDRVPEMRAVLTLFEGVATGAADGYARLAGKPAATLLHLGPGLGNGWANLHNARRAHVPLVNVVGDHATYHQRFDALLQSDLWGLARSTSAWQRSTMRAVDVGPDAADAVAASYGPPGRIATLVVPADVSWTEGAAPAPRRPVPSPSAVPAETVEGVADVLGSGARAVLLIGGAAMHERGLDAAARIAYATGAKLLAETFPPVQSRGGGLPDVEKLAYFGEMAMGQLDGARHLVLAGAKRPVSFFAYPGKPSDLVPEGMTVHELAGPAQDVPGALAALADALGADVRAPLEPARRPDRPSGRLTTESMAAAVGHLLPEDAIVVDESVTSGLSVPGATSAGPRHDWLAVTGGSIGQGLPAATGAAVAAPGRRVLSLEADGSAMYTLQALWTQAREGLDVTTLLLANHSYAILQFELARVGATGSGERAAAMLDLHHPVLDFVGLARGMGVPAERATTADELSSLLEQSFADSGPMLVEAVLA